MKNTIYDIFIQLMLDINVTDMDDNMEQSSFRSLVNIKCDWSRQTVPFST